MPATLPGRAPVKPDRILSELSDLWRTAAQPEAGAEPQENTGVLKACALTLIVFADDEDDPAELGETIARIMRDHPSRAVVVRVRGTADELDARVFAQCWMPFGHNRQVCCEQVELTVSLNRLGDIPSIVSPLAAPDLPRVVWFRSSRISKAPDISEILYLADKLIVDSSRPGAPAFADLRSLVAAGFIVGDLSWTRITKLRELIAQLLEGKEPAAIRKTIIEHCGAEPGPEAKYMQAWLRANLPGATVDFERTDPEGTGSIKGIRLDPGLDIRVETSCAKYQSGSLRQSAHLSPGLDHELLSEELSIMRRDAVFEQALRRMSIWIPKS
jgi:glucose-6-phosphate dehydrogenase assembly protein OpcA